MVQPNYDPAFTSPAPADAPFPASQVVRAEVPPAVPAHVRQPQDHQKPADVLRAEALADAPEGHELLRPVSHLRSAELADAQASLMELFEGLGVDFGALAEKQAARENGDEAVEDDTLADLDIEFSPAVIRAIGGLGTTLEKFAIDPAKFAEFDRGPEARQKVMDLGMWYLNAVGE